MSCCDALKVILIGHPLMGRFTAVPGRAGRYGLKIILQDVYR